ncbi:MAG: hypothetical protein K6T17_06130, partial [Fimbriimonadales bacterium]|nr:hypothetical protein [Fimbriimonadales bacterium]
SWTVREWLRQPPKVHVRADLERIGFFWEKLVEGSLITEGGENLNQKLEGGIRDIVKEAKKGKLEEARKRLGELRSTFEESASSGTIGGPGSVMRAIWDYVVRAPEKLREGIRRFALEDFLDLQAGGFNRMSRLLSELSNVFARIRSMEPTGATGATDQWLNAIEDASHSCLLGMLFLRKRVRDRLAERLNKALEEEMRNRKERALVNSMKRPIGDRTHASSSLDRLEKTLAHYRERFENLKGRLSSWQEKLQQEYEKLRDSRPRGNGVYLFKEGKDDGTVDREFENLLSVQDPHTQFQKKWEDEREDQARKIIRDCQKLAEALVKIPEPGEEHWLDQPRWQTDGKDLIPEKLCQELLRLASEPFQKLSKINVLERWYAERDKAPIARDVMNKAEPFLEVSSAEARRGSMTEYQTHAVLLVPPGDTPIRDEFMQSINFARSGYKEMDSPNPYRVVAIKYIMGFPLKAAEPIYAVNGLHTAECTDWPNFHARKDVNWRAITVGVSEKQKEIKRLFAVALLLGLDHVVKIEGGKLVASIPDFTVRTKRELKFPLNLSETARLCDKGYDEQNEPVGDIVRALQDAISAHLRGKGEEEHIRAIQQGYSKFSEGLIRDWHDIPELLRAYYESNRALNEAWKRISPPTEDRKNMLRDKEGYKCRKCGKSMGTEEDFEGNNWTCPTCGEYYGSAR